jgi:hypothetical protein
LVAYAADAAERASGNVSCDLEWATVASAHALALQSTFAVKCRFDLLGADLNGSPCTNDSQCLNGRPCDTLTHRCNHTDADVLDVRILY